MNPHEVWLYLCDDCISHRPQSWGKRLLNSAFRWMQNHDGQYIFVRYLAQHVILEDLIFKKISWNNALKFSLVSLALLLPSLTQPLTRHPEECDLVFCFWPSPNWNGTWWECHQDFALPYLFCVSYRLSALFQPPTRYSKTKQTQHRITYFVQCVARQVLETCDMASFGLKILHNFRLDHGVKTSLRFLFKNVKQWPNGQIPSERNRKEIWIIRDGVSVWRNYPPCTCPSDGILLYLRAWNKLITERYWQCQPEIYWIHSFRRWVNFVWFFEYSGIGITNFRKGSLQNPVKFSAHEAS